MKFCKKKKMVKFLQVRFHQLIIHFMGFSQSEKNPIDKEKRFSLTGKNIFPMDQQFLLRKIYFQ
jgi:hypothetical protein